MKKVTIFILLFISAHSYAQVPNDDLNKFVGTWQWSSGNDTVKIVLQKQIITMPNGTNNEDLVGWHKYVRNGVTVQNSLPNIGLSYNNENITPGNDLDITLYGFKKTPSKILFVRFWDLTLHKKCNLYFELLPSSLTQAHWKLTDPQGVNSNSSGTYNQFTLPRDLVLSKQ